MASRTKGETLPRWIIQYAGILFRRRCWFLVPFAGGIVLSAGTLLLGSPLSQTALSPLWVKEWLKAEETKTLQSKMENLKRELKEQEGEINRFKQMYRNELASSLSANLRLLGGLHVQLHEKNRMIQRMVQGDKNQENMDWQSQYKINDPASRHPFEVAASRASRDKIVAQWTKEKKALEGKIAVYESRIRSAPQREQELASLVRKGEAMHNTYSVLLGEKLTQSRSYRPIFLWMSVAELVSGFGLGVLLVMIRERMDRSIHTLEELEQSLALPVLTSLLDYRDFSKQSQREKASLNRQVARSGIPLHGTRTILRRRAIAL